jgi:hypothetical protein
MFLSASPSPREPHEDMQHTGTERRPSSRTPPSNNKTKKPTKARTTSLSSPQVDRARRRGSRTYLRNDSGSNEREDHGDQVTGPVGQVSTGGNTSAESDAHTTDKVEGG